MQQNHNKLKNYLESSKISQHISDITIKPEQVSLYTEPKKILRVLEFLRDDPECRFRILLSICGVDYLGRPKRFEVVYILLSIELNQRIVVKIKVGEGEAVPSSISLFSAANWYERETWDMYGIPFDNHPDLRRILTDYSFVGHPLRKDFPLTGFTEVRYNQTTRQVEYDSIFLPQTFRNFDLEKPWRGTEYVLPGDEKAT